MKLLVWDFDGTLGFREGRFSGVLAELLREEAPDIVYTRSALTVALQGGFPWHTPEIEHLHISDGDSWWKSIEPVFERAFCSVGIDIARAPDLARKVRARYCSPEHWRLYSDAHEALRESGQLGWRHVLLTNHVPELNEILDHLGLSGYFLRIANSAVTGYEKPHPQAFRRATDGLAGIEDLWMIGDSLVADIQGARAVGWKAILVHQASASEPCFGTLLEAVAFLRNASTNGANRNLY